MMKDLSGSADVLPFRVLAITDAAACRREARGVVETVARAILPRAAGCAVLVRAKDQPVETVAALCCALRPLTRAAGALLVVHGHVGLVRALGLDGAHLPSDAEPSAVRASLGPGILLGASRHANDRLDRHALAALDYVTLSPLFRPTSKAGDTRPTIGLAAFTEHAAHAARPVVALGGVDMTNAVAACAAGAAGIAVIGAVMSAHHPRDALLALLTASDRAARWRSATRGTTPG